MENRHAGRVVFENVRREHAWGHGSNDGLRAGCYLRLGQFDARAWLEEDADYAHTRVRLRFDVLDVVDARRNGPLEDRDHAVSHFLGRKAAVVEEHAEHGDVDVRKDVDGHRDDRGSAEERDQQRHNDKRIRASQCEPNYPHELLPL